MHTRTHTHIHKITHTHTHMPVPMHSLSRYLKGDRDVNNEAETRQREDFKNSRPKMPHYDY